MNKKTIKNIPVDVFQSVESRLDEIEVLFNPYRVVLSPAEKNGMIKFGYDFIKFLEISHKFAVKYPELFPFFREKSLLNKEFFIVYELWKIHNKMEELDNAVKDTGLLAGSCAMETALSFYQTVKIAARRDIPGARVIFEELKPALPSWRQRRRKTKKDNDEGQLELFD